MPADIRRSFNVLERKEKKTPESTVWGRETDNLKGKTLVGRSSLSADESTVQAGAQVKKK